MQNENLTDAEKAFLDMTQKLEESDSKPQTNRLSSDERQKFYFSTNLPKGDTSGVRYFRPILLPNGAPYAVIHFHNVKVGKYWMKLYDPQQQGNELFAGEPERSPLNELRNRLYKTGVAEDKELAKKYYSQRFYIFKGFETNADGDIIDETPKFWRFRENQKGDGVMDKLKPIFQSFIRAGQKPVWDIEEGMSLELNIQRVETPKRNGEVSYYNKVSSILATNIRKPLTTDKELLDKLTNDTTDWSDVYTKKPIEYLELVAQGETPRWDKNKEKFVAESIYTESDETSMSDGDEYLGEDEYTEAPSATETQSQVEKPQVPVDKNTVSDGSQVIENIDDLPF